ncbi:CDP-diacylglycerol--glycerol-3-phosphate 3-phosphatidyltransferase [Geomicrobium sp. JCM 19039]|uniref:CDP-diacylglycerol--glycerol-3-phosphate 3-phosphatidyltransferase n=1 Tax=Geomicrobium sp. JCM 19039 TaxID=1460636 RepID=UPI00045F17A6|nr:CDP-diacylglycerol--glycerol-3-phosphate 3-phosphatidyltransferase [Geomicrobium sp. JCM 19039]GAK10985.1 CDP-diacylglycerol-glycerol-3-phosphate 3-phosphatidyltransferase [Geomicrobium sp. JCM 19039]
MNLPNQITIARICFIPVFMIVFLYPFQWGAVSLFGTEVPVHHLVAALIYAFAALTDWVDGYIARSRNLVSNFGKFLDPLADKLLVTAALLSLIELDLLPAWMAVIILTREFAVTGMRLVAAADGTVIAASSLGKWKTVFQMVAIFFLMVHNAPFESIGIPFADFLMWMAVLLTIVSGIDYFWKNKHVFKDA